MEKFAMLSAAMLRRLRRAASLFCNYIFIALGAVTITGASAVSASAQDRGHEIPGQFDFYVLSLSWSPSFCASASGSRAAGQQCGPRPYAFVVHGLWPQYENGFPQACQVPSPRLDHRIVDSMLDLMPAPRLIYNEWDKHGTCSGLSPRDYFDTVRKARQAITVPSPFDDPQQTLSVTPAMVIQAFTKANPGLSSDGIAVECSRDRLSEIRLCLTKELKFRGCADVARHSCRRQQLTMPPVRGG